jgi:hypothetical protein
MLYNERAFGSVFRFMTKGGLRESSRSPFFLSTGGCQPGAFQAKEEGKGR